MTTTTEKTQKLYLRSWEYNAALILDELEKIVIREGGAVVSTWRIENKKPYRIVNRSLMKEIRDLSELVNRLEKNNRPTAAEQRAKLERLEAIPNEERTVRNGSFLYLSFVLDGNYYSYNLNDNPFFDFYFSKIPVENGMIDQDRYGITDNKEWWDDKLWSFNVTDAERKKIAWGILRMLRHSPTSKPYRGGRRPQKLYFLEGNEDALK